MAQTQNLGISQLPNGNWCYRFTRTVNGKRVNRKGSKDEAGNPLKTKRAAAQAKAIAEMRFDARRVVCVDISPTKWDFYSTVSATASLILPYLLEISLILSKLRLIRQNKPQSKQNKSYFI